MDPNLTVEVNNDELDKLIDTYRETKEVKELNTLLNYLPNRRILVASSVNAETKQASPCLIQNSQGENYLPVYTALKHLPKEPKTQAILNMTYFSANAMVANANGKIKGVVINPFTSNLVFEFPLVKKIMDVETQKQKQVRNIKMTPEQYMVFERVAFEKGFLPKKFFENPEEVMTQLKEQKETYLDQLFEESYKEKRMYPYLEEDFSVMLMNVSDEQMVARIEFPTKDVGIGTSIRGFLCWNKEANTTRYFLIDRAKEGIMLSEITKKLSLQTYGQAPVEGAELQRIVDLIQSSELTS